MKKNAKKEHGPVMGGAERIQRAYREVLDRYNRLVRSLPVAFFEIESDRRISFINESAERAAGYHAGELLNKDFTTLLQTKERRLFMGLLTNILKGKEPEAIEIQLIMKDGSKNYFELTGFPLLREGKITGMGLTARDLEEVKKLRDNLKEVKRKAAETSDKLKENIKELEEFALIAVRRELKMTEIREMLARYTEKDEGKAAPRPPRDKGAAFSKKGAKEV
ncbi:MAG: PAS domain S-box protein [Thermodesulfobacteriota bacterium]